MGEQLGYLLTGTWTTLVGIAVTQTVIGAVLALCAPESVGPAEREG